MTVENRKLFANRDARRRLSAMGGIMASSPELLGEAQLYAGGGPVRQVPGYLDTMADVSPNNPDRNMDLIAALNQSTRGAEFADWLNSVGQAGLDAAASVFRKTGASGMQLDAELGMAMSMAAAYLGFPEKAAEWRANAQDEMRYATDMQEGRINILGRPTEPQFVLPDSARRMYDKAAVERTIAEAGPDSSLLAEGSFAEPLSDIPASIIQSRITPPPEAMTEAPSLMAPGMDAPAGAPAGAQAGIILPGAAETVPSPGAASQLPAYDVSTGIPLSAKEIENQLFADRLALADEGYMHPSQTAADRFPSEDVIRAEQDAASRLASQRAAEGAIDRRMTSDQPTAEVSAPKVLSAADEMERLARESADAAAAEREAAGITDARNSIGAAISEGRPEDAAKIAEEARAAVSPATGPDLTQVEQAATNPDATPDQRVGDVTKTILTGLGVENAGDMSVKDRVSAYESLFKEMLGEKDEDLQKEMWMNMAMIGFAIAAGESPNALQNISQGLLQGTKMMREDKATRQAREDKIRMLAISEGLTDERAQEKFDRDLQLAAIKSTDYGVRTDPLTAMYRLAGDMYNSGAGDYNSYSEALKAARQQIEIDYNITLPESVINPPEGGSPQDTAGLPTVSTQAEYDALPPGARFMQNGQVRRKPAA